MTTQVLGTYSFATAPDVAGNLVLVTGQAISTSNVVATGGTIDGTTVGATTPAAGKFTTLSATALNSTIIGNSAAATGQFTTVGIGTAPLTTSLITFAAGSNVLAPVQFTAGPVQTTAGAGDLEYDGGAFYATTDTTNGRTLIGNWNHFRLTGSGGGITTIADFFGSTSAIPLVAGGIYEIEWHCYFSQATSGTGTWTIVSTNALQSLTGEYIGSNAAGIGTTGTAQTAGINVTGSTSQAFPTTGTNANGATHHYLIRAMLQANATTGGNTRLRYTANTGTATPLINSYFKVRHLSAANTGTFVA